jgi:predicted NBD/HSP70 family sugar kinase
MENRSLLYKRLIIKHLYYNASLSCAELSVHINKSLPITTKILNELIEEGSVEETGLAPSTGGRRPIMYALKQEVAYIVAVAIDQFITRIAIMDMKNHYILPVERFELPLSEQKDALAAVVEKIEKVIAKSSIPKDKIAGIGIGMPGFVDVKKGINYTFLPSPEKSITRYVFDKTGIPVHIDNDSRLIALAEQRFGRLYQKKNALVVNISWGIGLGMILNGELFRGQNGFSGEFSHIPLFMNGKLCSCGKTGCLETETSLLLLVEKARKGLEKGRVSILGSLPMEQLEDAFASIITAVRKGDQFAIELLSEAGYNIGRGVAVLIHILNPEVIILSGRGSTAGMIWQAPIQQALNEHCIPRLASNTHVEVSAIGYEAELIGAAALVMEHFEKEPVRIGNNLKV